MPPSDQHKPQGASFARNFLTTQACIHQYRRGCCVSLFEFDAPFDFCVIAFGFSLLNARKTTVLFTSVLVRHNVSRLKLAFKPAQSSTNLNASFSPGKVSQHRAVSMRVMVGVAVNGRVCFRRYIPSSFVGYRRFFRRPCVTLRHEVRRLSIALVLFAVTRVQQDLSRCCCCIT